MSSKKFFFYLFFIFLFIYLFFFSVSSHHNGINRVLHSVFRGSISAHLALLLLGRLYKGQKILISALLLKEIKWDVEEFLKDSFPRKKQIILAPYHRGNSLAPYHGRISFFLDKNSFERSLGREMAYVNAASDEKSTSAVLENLSARNSSAQAKFPLFRL